MLCKLNSPTEVVTQACFDKELLKISPINAPRANNLDDYTIRTSTFDITSNTIGPNSNFDAPLNLSIRYIIL